MNEELPQSAELTAPSVEGASVRCAFEYRYIVQIVRYYKALQDFAKYHRYLREIALQSPLPQKRVARHRRDGCSSLYSTLTNILINQNLRSNETVFFYPFFAIFSAIFIILAKRLFRVDFVMGGSCIDASSERDAE